MSLINDIANLFGNAVFLDNRESFSNFEASFDFVPNCQTDTLQAELEAKFSLISESSFDLSVTINTVSESIIFNNDNIDLFDTKFNEYQIEIDQFQAGDVFKINFLITKLSAIELNIFDFSKFSTYLDDLSLVKSFESWGKYNYLDGLNVKIWEEFEGFSTRSISLMSVYPDNKTNEFVSLMNKDQRNKIIDERDKNGHYANAGQFDFMPDDFKIIGLCSNSISSYFRGLHNALNIVFLSDFSAVVDNSLKYRIKGYKLLVETLGFGKLKQSSTKELNEIFDWAYTGGNFSDKIGLARNVISIHTEANSILSVEDGTIDSVKSGYDLYLKENVKQYIEIKNKISDFLLNQSEKAQNITGNMFSTLKTNLWTISTFFISVFLLRVVNKDSLSGAITEEVLIVSVLLIFISTAYFILSIQELNYDRDRFLKKYVEIKGRYKDLLDKKDLNKIIDDKKIVEEEKRFINHRRNLYIYYWVGVVVAFILVISVLFSLSDNKPIVTKPTWDYLKTSVGTKENMVTITIDKTVLQN